MYAGKVRGLDQSQQIGDWSLECKIGLKTNSIACFHFSGFPSALPIYINESLLGQIVPLHGDMYLHSLSVAGPLKSCSHFVEHRKYNGIVSCGHGSQ